MKARVGIAVDSSCDLTPEFISQHRIEILPIHITYDGGSYQDNRDVASMMHFYKTHNSSLYSTAQSEPCSVEELGRIIKHRFLPKYDRMQIITINSHKSQVYNRVSQAALINEPKFRANKIRDPNRPPFRIRLFDSTSMFTGHAVLVREFMRLIKEERKSLSEATNLIDKLRDQVIGYIIPRDLSYMRERRKLKKGDHKISWLSYRLSSMLNIRPIIKLHKGQTQVFKKCKGFNGAMSDLFAHAKQEITKGLCCNTVVMSYGGLLSEIQDTPELLDFRNFAERRGISTMLSMMSTTAAINVGPKAFSLAFAVPKP